MKLLFKLLFSYCVSFGGLFAQDISIKFNEYKINHVNSSKGLCLYEKPNDKSRKIITVGNSVPLFIISNIIENPTQTIDDVYGDWASTYYRGEFGYVFYPYLSEISEDNYTYFYEKENIKNIYYTNANIGMEKVDVYDFSGTKTILELDSEEVVYVLELDKLVKYKKEYINAKVKIRYKNTVGYIYSSCLMSHDYFYLHTHAQPSND